MAFLTTSVQALLDSLTALLAAHPLAAEWYMAFVRFLFPVLAVLISYMMRRATEGGAHARIFLREKEELRSGEDMQVLLGKQGRTTSVLRPAGIGDFDGVRLNVVTEGSFIERDRPIEIVNVDGARIVVRERQSA